MKKTISNSNKYFANAKKKEKMIVNSVLRSHTGLIRLYFDAVYQERKYGRSDVDTETGELKQ